MTTLVQLVVFVVAAVVAAAVAAAAFVFVFIDLSAVVLISPSLLTFGLPFPASCA